MPMFMLKRPIYRSGAKSKLSPTIIQIYKHKHQSKCNVLFFHSFILQLHIAFGCVTICVHKNLSEVWLLIRKTPQNTPRKSRIFFFHWFFSLWHWKKKTATAAAAAATLQFNAVDTLYNEWYNHLWLIPRKSDGRASERAVQCSQMMILLVHR